MEDSYYKQLDQNNPFIAWPLRRLIDMESYFIKPEFSMIFETMKTANYEGFGFDPDSSLYENIYDELSFLIEDHETAISALDEHIRWMTDPDRLMEDIEMMTTIGIEQSLIDIEQWANWEIEMYKTLSERLKIPLPRHFGTIVELYPQIWRDSLEVEFSKRISEKAQSS